ncbi:DNA-directed RNA polymerase III subunit 1 isoform X3 [Salvia miltiorrhiza]|uniref:DNA-directed RNA polymerase III subunit 1 isoform X3 n=1 Tax=Salvia miltiorrhiza TaxID=226208 RepID=UPI0025AB79FA|nr:DNA-directed RNA polymerase III subunit 1 isoform X3 [Salvia miltiorrhiza]
MRRDQGSMQFTKQPYLEDVGPRKIESLKFSTFSENEILKISEVQVSRGIYYNMNRKPEDSGLLDPHMGPPNKFGKCETCGGNYHNCPGHCGFLTLALPVYNVGFLGAIVDIMKCICKKCSIILLDEKQRQDFLKKMRNPKLEHLKKVELLKNIVKKCNGLAGSKRAVVCPRCGYINGMVKRVQLKIQHDRSKVADSADCSLKECQSALSHTKGNANLSLNLDPKRAYELLKNMRDEDCELLYLDDRPENLMVTNILVPPTAIRPSVFVDGGTQSNENDITERLKYIIQANASLRSEMVEKDSQSNRFMVSWQLLQEEVAQYINSDVRGLTPQPLGNTRRPLSGFVQRLKGKQGRFRGNLSGKRVEYTGRTVISPDPNLKITEVAIPILMARILTYPERVSHHNIEKLRQCVRNGPHKYPGAKFIRTPDGHEISLMYSARKHHADQLKYGCIVNRHLEDGDVVLFNRQPSLHRMSIMSHRARIMPWRTLRFNESVCNPYNADFDGDEMNMHVPQTEEARTEALMLMGVQNNLCTPKNGEILVASTQDFLTSSFLITRKDTFYDRSDFSLMCSYIGDAMDPIDLPTPTLIKPVELWTGKQLFSVLLRPHAKMRVYLNLTVAEKNYGKSRESMCSKDGFVYIRNSELISGQLGKATLGNGNKDGIYSVLLRDYGPHAAATCMNRLAKLSARWIGNHGFSIGINDVQPGYTLTNEKKALLDKEYGHCTNYIRSYTSGSLELLPGCNNAETLEAKISETLNKIRETVASVCMDNLNWRNSPLIMSQCGSKGSPINICQMIACVGQQSVGGHRAPNGFVDRTLPHFVRGAKDPDAKGFVQNSFYTGLSATEFFFHTMGGREGLVDTAVKTADTGYMSRRLMKALEDLSIFYDNTVRNASACIVQFMYGGDAMDPAQMEEKSGLPLNFERLFMKAKATCPATEQKSLTSDEIEEVVKETLERKLLSMTSEGGRSESTPSSDTASKDECLEAFGKSISDFIKKKGPSSVLEKLKLSEGSHSEEDRCYLENVASSISGITQRQLMVFLETCICRYNSKKIEAGTAIGAIGAQSIGEPGTQMTLKTFHFAGVASMNVTLGVPRIKEIINAAKNMKTPIISTYLDVDNSEITAKMVKGRIEKTLLEQVARSIKTSQSSRLASIVVTLDMGRIKEAYLHIDAYSVKESILRTPRMKLKEQHIRVLDEQKLEVILEADKSKLQFELHGLKNKLSKVVVKGISSVERVIVLNEAKEKDTDGSKKLKLVAEGTDLLHVMGTEGVNGNKTESNNIPEVHQVLGIEAARKKIIEEIKYTMSSHGMTIDIRHMMLLADLMTFKVILISSNHKYFMFMTARTCIFCHSSNCSLRSSSRGLDIRALSKHLRSFVFKHEHQTARDVYSTFCVCHFKFCSVFSYDEYCSRHTCDA